MPPKRTTAAAKAVKNRKAAFVKGKGKKDVKAKVDEESEVEKVVKVQTPADIFPTFHIDARLLPGLSIIRPLGGKKYEIVNLNAISQNVLGSEETGELIKSDPARLSAMTINKKEWDSAILKCDIAVRVTEKGLFRLFALPTELQDKILKLVVSPVNGMRYRRGGARDSISPAVSLMLTCKQMHEVCKTIFWKDNSFFVEHLDLSGIKKIGPTSHFCNNVTKLTYSWKENIRDNFAFRVINQFPNLKALHLEMYWYILELHIKYPHNPNLKCRNEKSFGIFREFIGFDALLEIRGLTSVTLKIRDAVPIADQKQIQDAQYNFMVYLKDQLTLPKPPPKPVSTPNARRLAQDAQEISDTNSYLQMLNTGWLQKRISKAKAKVLLPAGIIDADDEDEESEEELEEEVYVPKQTRTRTAKVIKRLS